MKTLNALKLRIMTRAFKIRIAAGEVFEDIAADYPSLTTDDLEAIKAELEKTNNVDAAAYLGTVLGKKAVEAGITEVVFDRGGFIYQGKIQAFADAAREAGLVF